MPDPYASISQSDESLQRQLADVLELRATDTRQQEMLSSFLSDLEIDSKARVLEVGCGTGAISRVLAQLEEVDSLIGIDPSPVFIERANELSKGISNLFFQTGDARSLNFADESFDLIVFYTTLCHVPSPMLALQEANRLLRPGGKLAIFEGDYSTATVATDTCDPLQVAVEMTTSNFVENKWLPRQLPKHLKSYGFVLEHYRSYGYTQVSEPHYFLSIINRGVDLLVNTGRVGPDLGDSLRDEATRRVDSGAFFGHISYVSAISTKT